MRKYSLKNNGDETQLVIEEATASREWMTVALRKFVVGQSVPLPAKASVLLELLT